MIHLLDGRDVEVLESAELQPINLTMPVLMEFGVRWLVRMYISDNPCIQESQVRLMDKSWSQDNKPSGSSNDKSTRDFSDLSDEDRTDFYA